MDLEASTAEELKLLGVTPHITHLKQEEWCIYSFVTVATSIYETYQHLAVVLSEIYLEGSFTRTYGSDLDRLIVKRFGELTVGASPCHAVDNFSRKRGRIIAKGRLLKILRAGRRDK